MKRDFTRREFIKISGMGLGGLAASGSLLKFASDVLGSGNASPHKVLRTPTYCEMCTFKCAGWAYRLDGKPWKIIGNENDQHCYGHLCTKGSAGFGAYDDPDRLKTPLIRMQERGKQVFKEVSWDEAFNYIASKLKKIAKEHGPECVALLTHGTGGSFFKTFLQGYGSDNIAAPSYANCRGPREEAYLLTFGDAISTPERTDMRNSKCIVLIGSHIGENTHSSQVYEFGQAVQRGATIITVDPRFSVAASKSKYWLPIKPGTDVALLLAWINVIVEEELYDKEYIKRYAIGFDELRKAVKDDTPEWAYSITTIKPEIIRETAREMARYLPATLIHPGRHVVWYGDDTQRVRAGAVLNALLGSWGRKGGFFMPVEPDIPEYPRPQFPKPKRSWRDAFPGKYELANLALSSGICEATIPSVSRDCNFKGWIVYGTNLLHALPDRKKTIEAIQNLELLVVVDILPSEISGWADVVLPECTYLERYDDLRTEWGRESQIALRMPAFKPKYNTKPAWWIAKQLANKMGLGQYFSWKNIEEYLDYRLKKAGSSLREMQEIGVKVLKRETPLYLAKGEEVKFDTPSGKIELYSQTLKDYGFDPVPRYAPHEEPPKGYYRLLYGRSPSHSFGRTTNNPLLTQMDPENEIWINTDVSKEWGLKDGQYLRLENQDGVVSNRVKVKVTERIRTDCVYMVHGFGHDQKKMKRSYMKGASDTGLITRTKVDPIMGGVGMRANFVTFSV
ncbi:MAG: nitrate reductase [Deltaproteobacteria bacterium]|jgi:thiosulfate reductase/polysulfide reductase chain A|nr:MAG: nitrate reductase [Deltaproteobacteria bacterium]